MEYSFLEHILFPKKRVNLLNLEKALVNKTVLITGATFGIGEELSRFLAFKDVKLILVGRTIEKLKKLQLELIQKEAIVEIYSVDLRDENQLYEFIKYLKSLGNGIDIFVSNAGKSIRRSVFDSLNRFHDYQRTMGINYFAPVKLCLSLIPILEKNKGQIINVSAINVLFIPAPKWSAYQASKIAFDHFFKSISPELSSKNITLSTLYLPLVRTRMIEPTKIYNSFPAMKPSEVAKEIARLIITKKRVFKPWWTVFVEFGSFIFKPFLVWGFHKFNKK